MYFQNRWFFLEAGRWKGVEGTQNLGADGLGEVVALGDGVEQLKVGDYVTCVFCAAFSEYTTPKASNCFKVPSLDPAYAALRVAGTYSCCLLDWLLVAESGKTILITAACGGVGHIVVQIAKLNGCHVIGTCGGPVKKESVMKLGADRVIDYTTEVSCYLIRVIEILAVSGGGTEGRVSRWRGLCGGWCGRCHAAIGIQFLGTWWEAGGYRVSFRACTHG